MSSTRKPPSQQRVVNRQRMQEQQDRNLRQKLKKEIKERIQSVPVSWKRIYLEKLEKNNINSKANIDNVNNLDSLHLRHSLLPPEKTYRHHTNPRNPSRPEHRALACKLLKNHTREYAAKVCSNDRIIRDALTIPEGTNVKRFKPENIAYLKLNKDQHVCAHPNNVKQMNRNGFQIAADYQKGSKADEWPEVRLDIPFSMSRSGTGWTPGETLQVRLPYHVAEECNIKLKPQKNRLSHPTHPENAR